MQKKKRKKAKDTNSSSDECSENETDDTNIRYGVSFWIAYDAPEISNLDFENAITRKFLSSGLDVQDCRSLRGRGNSTDLSVHLFFIIDMLIYLSIYY